MNYSKETVNEAIFLYIIHNFEHIKELIKPMNEAKKLLLENENVYFKDDILKQFKDNVKKIIVDEATIALAIPAEDVYNFLDAFNLETFYDR